LDAASPDVGTARHVTTGLCSEALRNNVASGIAVSGGVWKGVVINILLRFFASSSSSSSAPAPASRLIAFY